MGLHGGQVDDVISDEPFGDADAFGEDFIQSQHLGLGFEENPLLAGLIQMDVAQAVFAYQNLLVLVGDLTALGIYHDGAVVTAV